MRPMFGHHERRRVRKVKDLACDVAAPGALRQRIGVRIPTKAATYSNLIAATIPI